MKKSVLLCLLSLIFLAVSTQAQKWTKQNPSPTFQNLFGISFPSADTGFICGGNSLILRTIDGGATWEEQNFPFPGRQLHDVNFINNNRGYIPSGRAVYYTFDTGETWSYSTLPGLFSAYEKTSFLGDSTIFAFGLYGRIAKSSDMGLSWELFYLAANYEEVHTKVQFANHLTGYIGGKVRFPNEAPIFRRTDDGGQTWQDVAIPSAIKSVADVAVISPDDVWIGSGNSLGGKSNLYHSTDGGLTWNMKIVGNSNSSEGIKRIKFFNALEGYALNSSHLFKTMDGGETWIDQYLFQYFNSSIGLENFSWPDKNTGYFCGYNPEIFKTVDGGESYQDLMSGTTAYLKNISFRDSLNGITFRSYSPINGAIFYTDDGGEHWQEATVHNSSEHFILRDFAWADGLNGWITGQVPTLLRTYDGGVNWHEFPTNSAGFLKISIPDPDHIFATTTSRSVVTSTDNGITWQDISTGQTNAEAAYLFMFTDSLTGYIVNFIPDEGKYKFMKTNNGGSSWNEVNYLPSRKIVSMSFADNLSGMMSLDDYTVLVTHDGGESWTAANFEKQNYTTYVKMFSPLNGIASSVGDRVSVTHDGGLNFYEVFSGANGWPVYNHSFFLNENLGWGCGEGGMIMRYDCLETGVSNFKEDFLSAAKDDLFFPNPSNDRIYLRNTQFDQLTIINQQGQTMYSARNSGTTEIDISGLSPGVYVVSIVSKTGRHQQKLVKL